MTLPTPVTRKDRNFVSSLQKGLNVLTCFGRQHARLTVSQAAALTGETPASARRALLTLEALGYLETDGKHFWMAAKSLLVAHSFLSSRPAPSLAQPLLNALSDRSRESASLGQLLDDDAIIIARSTARRGLSVGLGVGSRLPVYCSAIGRCLLASLPEEEAARRLAAMELVPFTPKTVYKAKEVLSLLTTCRSTGHSECNEELELGVRSIAVPVFDRSGATVAAMSIAVSAERMQFAEFREAFLPALLKARKSLGEKLYPP